MHRLREGKSMDAISMWGVVIRFLIGGGAVAGSSVLASKLGGKFGGIFASFPAVFLAALLTLRLESTGIALLRQSTTLSKGALVGMVADIVCAMIASYLCPKIGWKLGLLYSVGGWFLLSSLVLAIAK